MLHTAFVFKNSSLVGSCKEMKICSSFYHFY